MSNAREMQRYELRVHFHMGPDPDDVQTRHAYGRTSREAAESFLRNADRCHVEVLSPTTGKVIREMHYAEVD